MPPWALADHAGRVLAGAGERPAPVAEELRVDQVARDAGAVVGDELLPGTARAVVDDAGEHLLAGPRLAGDQHGQVAGGDVRRDAQHAPHRSGRRIPPGTGGRPVRRRVVRSVPWSCQRMPPGAAARPQGRGARILPPDEVRRRHLRLPRQPGRLVRARARPARGGRLAGGGRAAADLVVVNSCSVTASADQGTRQAIRRIARTNAGARIVATGCYASRAAAEVAALPGVVAVVPNAEKEALAERILDTAETTTAERFGAGDGACGAPIRPGERGRTAYTLRVQTGCDEACAYCIIPSTRARAGAAASR